jgi:hypothetical protein
MMSQLLLPAFAIYFKLAYHCDKSQAASARWQDAHCCVPSTTLARPYP